jgi:formate dehydrogenase iron-sulfur subunit
MATAMLIDLSKCTGCRSCQVACKAWNDLPGEVTICLGCYDNPPDLSPSTWNRIAFHELERDNGRVAWLFRPVRCLHCTEASCVEVCPTGAAAHRGDAVVIDPEWCIGCGYCETACPFDVPRLGEGAEKASARKCWFCADRVTVGLQPSCASACPTGAIEFGDRNALIAKGQDRVAALKQMGLAEANLYGDKLLGGLGQMYVLTDPPSIFDLPEAPKVSTRTVAGSWLSGLLTAGVVAAVPFWLLFRRRETLAAEGIPPEEVPTEEVSAEDISSGEASEGGD